VENLAVAWMQADNLAVHQYGVLAEPSLALDLADLGLCRVGAFRSVGPPNAQ